MRHLHLNNGILKKQICQLSWGTLKLSTVKAVRAFSKAICVAKWRGLRAVTDRDVPTVLFYTLTEWVFIKKKVLYNVKPFFVIEVVFSSSSKNRIMFLCETNIRRFCCQMPWLGLDKNFVLITVSFGVRSSSRRWRLYKFV